MSQIQLIHGNCEDYLHLMADNQYDLAIVDPPYFSGPERRKYYGKSVSTTNTRRVEYPTDVARWQVPGPAYFEQLFRVSRHQIIWGCNYFDVLYPGPGRIVWDKCNGTSSFSDCEIAYCSLHDSVRLFPFMWNGMCQGKSITQGRLQRGDKRLNQQRIHPTEKPIELYKWLLSTYAQPGWKILDTHFGSGSIALACYDLGFDLTAYEIEAVHHQNAVKRFNQYTAQMPVPFSVPFSTSNLTIG